MSIDSIQRSGETLEVLVGESLNEDDVRTICNSLIVKPPAAEVIVNLRRMRMEEGSALAILLRGLERAGTPYSFVGLNSVQERVRRYLAPELAGQKQRDRGRAR